MNTEHYKAQSERTDADERALTPAFKRTQPQHSPLPWSTDPTTHKSFSGQEHKSNAVIASGKLLGKLVGFSEANARLIVASVNHADALAEALRDIETLAQCTVPQSNIAGHLRAIECKATKVLAVYGSEAAQ